ncbi:ABC transporter C family member [Arachis hypogaea]|nr:ABC transporter C family member [Arachis hypogaea]
MFFSIIITLKSTSMVRFVFLSPCPQRALFSAVDVLLLFTFSVFAIIKLYQSSSIIQAPWKVLDGVFWLVQAITQIVLAILIIHEKRFEAVNHPVSLRIYWIASFIVVSLFTASGVIRFSTLDVDTFMVDDIVSFISLPISLFLLCVGIKGSTGIKSSEDSQVPINDEIKDLRPYRMSLVSLRLLLYPRPFGFG